MRREIQRFLDHLWGPTGSLILHVIIVMLLVRFVVFQTLERTPEVEVVIMEPDAMEFEIEKELELLEDLPRIEDTITPPEVALEMEEPPDVEPFAQPEGEVDYAALDIASDVTGPLIMKNLWAGRSAGMRSAMLNEFAGKWGEVTESAVVKALEWLKKNQNADGSWGPNKVAMTGLGLLTFLAHGETTSSAKYGTTVEKAIKYLVSRQDEKGRFCQTDNQPGPYAHAIATYAISEAYGLTRIPALKPVMEKAVQVILDGQQAGGGWNYKYDRGPRRDTSVGAWQIQALKAALLAGSENAGIKAAMEKAVRDLRSVQNPETGRFGYTDAGWGTDGVCAAAILSMQLMGYGEAKETKQALAALKNADCSWEKPGSWALYGWYYITQAKFHQGGPSWNVWNSKFARELTKNQNADGSWTAPGEAAGVKEGKENPYGPAYATTFAALTLQVYYRFLPTYKPVAVQPTEEVDKDDVVIEII